MSRAPVMKRAGGSAIVAAVRRPLLLLLLCFFGSPARAQPSDAARAQATTAYDAGVAAFKAQNYAEALERFERAYKLDPSPVLLYNLARTHQEMRHWTQAIEHFELYLARVPDGDDRADVEARVRTMRNLLAEIEAAKADPPPPVEPPPAEAPPPAETPPPETPTAEARTAPGPSLRPYAYTAVGLTAAAAGVAIYFGVEASGAEDDHASARTGPDKADTAQRAEDAALAANLAWGGAGLFAAAAVTLFLLEPEAPAVALQPLPGGAAVGWHASF